MWNNYSSISTLPTEDDIFHAMLEEHETKSNGYISQETIIFLKDKAKSEYKRLVKEAKEEQAKNKEEERAKAELEKKKARQEKLFEENHHFFAEMQKTMEDMIRTETKMYTAVLFKKDIVHWRSDLHFEEKFQETLQLATEHGKRYSNFCFYLKTSGDLVLVTCTAK
jgi:hypothetical protein